MVCGYIWLHALAAICMARVVEIHAAGNIILESNNLRNLKTDSTRFKFRLSWMDVINITHGDDVVAGFVIASFTLPFY